MVYTGHIYFLGKYRPLAIEDTSPARIKIRMAHAIQDTEPELRAWLQESVTYVITELSRGYSSISKEHGRQGVSIRKGAHDRWLQHVIDQLPDCPGLNYNA